MGEIGADSARAALVAALDVVGAAPSERFERIVRVAREVFDVPLSNVNVLDDDLPHTLTPNVPDEIVSGPLGWSFCQLTVRQVEPTVICDTTTDPRTAALILQLADIVAYSAGEYMNHGKAPEQDSYLWQQIRRCMALHQKSGRRLGAGFSMYPKSVEIPTGDDTDA